MSHLKKHEIITVNYFGSKKTEQFLNSLALSGCSSKVIIIDNSTCSDEEYRLKKALENSIYKGEIELVISHQNTGYFGAVSSIVNQISEDAEWCIVCNNDLIFDHTTYTEICNQTARCSRGVLCIAPDVKDQQTNIGLNPFLRKRPDTRFILMLRLQFSSYGMFCLMSFANRLRKIYSQISFLFSQRGSAGQDAEVRAIYAAHGSIFILRRKLLADGIDFDYFLYGEEVSIAEKVLKLGGIISYEPSIKVIHQSHASTGSTWSYKTFKRKQRAIKYICERYF